MKVEYIVNQVFTTRSYILSSDDGKSAWLVDVGDTDRILERLSPETRVAGVLLTHVHYDHIYGLPSLSFRFPDCKVFTNEAGLSCLIDTRLNMSRYHDDPIAYGGDNVVVVKDRDRIRLFDDVFATVYETPGHHPTSLCFRVGDRLFTGDAYIPGVKVVTTLPGGDKILAKESLERIKVLAEGLAVLPGHD